MNLFYKNLEYMLAEGCWSVAIKVEGRTFGMAGTGPEGEFSAQGPLVEVSPNGVAWPMRPEWVDPRYPEMASVTVPAKAYL